MAPRALLITGASTGIGHACALHFAQLGWRVYAGVRAQTDALALRAAHPYLEPIRLDVTDPRDITNAADTVAHSLHAHGITGLAALINNAGIVVAGPLEYLPLHELRRQLDINVLGPVAVTQAFLPLLRLAADAAPANTRAPARIVNLSSVSGRIAAPFLGPYAASKFALEALSDALRNELHPWGIAVSLIEPGPINTPIWNKAAAWFQSIHDQLPPAAHQRYGPALDALRQYTDRCARNALPPARVIAAIHHALTSPRPRLRYPVGRAQAFNIQLLKFLPARWVDKAMRKTLRLDRRAADLP